MKSPSGHGVQLEQSRSFEFSPSKDKSHRCDSPEFRFPHRKAGSMSGTESLASPEAGRGSRPRSAASTPTSSRGQAENKALGMESPVMIRTGPSPPAHTSHAAEAEPASPSAASPMTPQMYGQKRPLGLTPLPLPLSPAHRHASSPTSTSSSTSFNRPRLSNARRRSSDGTSEGGSPDKGTPNLEKDTMALAAGTVTVALAANAVAMGPAASSPEKVVQRTWDWLAEQPEDAAELAQMLFEATPRLGVAAARSPKKNLRNKKQAVDANISLLDRLRAAEPMATGSGEVDWTCLDRVCASEVLKFEETAAAALEQVQLGLPTEGQRPKAAATQGDRSPSPIFSPRGELVEVNSGGQVLFCFFSPPVGMHFAQDRLLVLKFHPSRLQTQSEQFANELTRHLGICAPNCRILRATTKEWEEALSAAQALGKPAADLEEQLSKSGSCLVMDYVPGPAFFRAHQPFLLDQLHQTASDLGRLFLLDWLLGNPDRLPCHSLNWRGNPENLRFCTGGPLAGRMVAIDAVVQRRPPGGLVSKEDAACNRLAELALNDLAYASRMLKEAVSGCEWAADSMQDRDVCRTFQSSLRNTLQATMHVKGLLEMMFEVQSDWIDTFIHEMEGLAAAEGMHTPPQSSSGDKPGGTPNSSAHTSPRTSNPGHMHTPSGSRWGIGTPTTQTICTTMKIKSISREARQNELISERLNEWKAKMRERGEELRAAVDEWQAKHSRPDMPLQLTTGFLDGTSPIVDIYELKIRLEHMLQRLRALQDASATARPTQLLPHLYVSGAVEANSLHLLRHMGITHLLNATEDLLQPEPEAGFRCLRCPIRDEEEVDIAAHFQTAYTFIEEARGKREAVLVHCHEGKSRSVTLVLAYLMKSQKWTLKEALEFVSAARPRASPNAGFMARLLELDQELYGKQTVKVRKTKPEPRVCPVCDAVVGISSQSLVVHVKKVHPESYAELAESIQ